MPTFDDPLKDAAEASAALRGLAHATRTLDDPADTYPVIGDLLAGVRTLRQVLDQLATAHIDSRYLAYDDDGDQFAGATSALAAADELHQAGTLLDTVEWRLDNASQHSGRIAWHPGTQREAEEMTDVVRTTAQAGTLTLTVWPDTPLGEHQRYAYRVEDTGGEAIEGRDLFTGAGAPVSPEQALRELATFLRATGEARQYALDHPGERPGNDGLFPERTAEAARQNAEALTELAEHGPQPPEQAATGRRWISVVFLQGSEADEVLDLIDSEGTDAAIDRLSGFDYGEETTQAALENGYVYAAPPAGTFDRTTTRDVYALVHSPASGYVSLLREFTPAPEVAAEPSGGHRPVDALPGRATTGRSGASAGTAAAASARSVRPQAAGADWFTRRPGTASQGRRLAL